MRSIFVFLFLSLVFSCANKSVTERLTGKWETIGKTDSINSQIIFHKNRTVTMRNIVNGDTIDFMDANYLILSNGKEILLKSDSAYSSIKITIEELTDSTLILKNNKAFDSAKYLRTE